MPKRHHIKNLPVHTFKSFSDEADNFSIRSFSEMGSLSSTPLPHRHAFYEIIYIKQGKGAHVIDFETYPIVPGSLYLFSPDQIHFWQITKPVDGVRIKFSENFLLLPPAELYLTEYLDFFHNAESPPHLILHDGEGDEIKYLFDQDRERISFGCLCPGSQDTILFDYSPHRDTTYFYGGLQQKGCHERLCPCQSL